MYSKIYTWDFTVLLYKSSSKIFYKSIILILKIINNMKLNKLAVGIVLAASITGSAFAMDMAATGTMMKKDEMVKGETMMMKDKMMSDTDYSKINHKSGKSEIVKLQKMLVEKGHLKMPKGVAYGFYGKATRAAVAKHAGMTKDMPMAKKDIVDTAVSVDSLSTLVAAVKAADLVATLKSAGPFTVFAPNNAAFAKLATGTVESLLKADKKVDLTSILTYHVVAGKYTADKITDGLKLKTVNGKDLTFTLKDGKVMINASTTVISANVETANGVVHVIDGVLLP
jgi:uncharacterized surface protein with fasciclin (FAS1) repeats